MSSRRYRLPTTGLDFKKKKGGGKGAHGVRVQIGVRFQRRGFGSPIRARTRESESKEESDLLWTRESESKGESDLVWTPEPESRVQGGARFGLVRRVRSGKVFT
jgi:hypothetical protein